MSWTDTATRLAAAGQVPSTAVLDVQLRELFGKLIGNTDMHQGNLSFMAHGARVLELAPVYDMLPMHYSGARLEEAPELALPTPTLADAPVWDRASRAALAFWSAVARETAISSGFRGIAKRNAARVNDYRRSAERLPKMS